jgi:uncharacterized membrane protein (UPF0127 family)
MGIINTVKISYISMIGLANAVLFASPLFAICTPDAVDIRGPSGVSRFSVEVADEDTERQKGLMFRETMPMSQGMLFVFEQPKRAAFWMKDTLISLDMLFIDSTGTVVKVHENAIPLDQTPIEGGEGIAFVLEINGGLAKRMGIGPGSEIRHPLVKENSAKWSCSGE